MWDDYSGMASVKAFLSVHAGDVPFGKDRPARVCVLDLDGNVLTGWGDDPTGSIQFGAPHGISVERRGNVYVAEVREAVGADRSSWREAVRKLERMA
jgi:hypothetical protein